MAEQDVDLLVAAPLGQRNDPAELLERVVARKGVGIEFVDRASEDDLDETIDMAAGAINAERHFALQLEPALEHDIMFTLVGAVLLDRRNERVIVRRACPHCIKYAIDARVPAMLVIDVDRAQQIQVTAAEPA